MHRLWLPAALLLLGAASLPPAGRALAGSRPAHQASISQRCAHRNPATGSITIGEVQFPDTLNPYQHSIDPSGDAGQALFEGLFAYDAQFHLIPDVAARIPTLANGDIRDNGRTIIVRLKRGLRWSNGSEITSADVRFGWKIEMDPRTGPACAAGCNRIRRIDTPDRYTAVLRYAHVYGPALAQTMPSLWPVSWAGAWGRGNISAAVRALTETPSFNFENSGFPTNGPYQVAEVRPGQSILLRPMPYYSSLTCGARIAAIRLRYFANQSDLLRALLSREVDAGQTSDQVSQVAQIRQAGLSVRIRPSLIFEHGC